MAFLSLSLRGLVPRAVRCRAAGWLVVWALVGSPALAAADPAPAAAAAPVPEYRSKAVLLFQFTQFVKWPPRAFHDPKAPLIVGVLGDDPFGTDLDEAVQDEKLDEHPLIVRRYRRVEDIAECHVLFVSNSEAAQMDKIVARLKGRSILTVGDTDDFTRVGGMVRFVTENNKIRLRIDVDEAKAVDLTITSKLLRVSTIVTKGKD
jgi:uncharacterized protein DUF4154